MEQVSRLIEQFVNESNRNFVNDQLQTAIAKAEKAYSLSKNYEKCSETTRRKLEYNLAALYACSNDLDSSKAYLDLVKQSTVAFLRLHQIAILYAFLGNKYNYIEDLEAKEDCYKSAAEYLAKSEEWSKYCEIELIHAQLLSDLGRYKESYSIANKIQSACLFITDKKQLASIFCDLSTIYARDPRNQMKIKNAKRLLKLALNLISNQDISIEIEICIHQNLAAVNNQLHNFNRSIKTIQVAYNKLKQSTKSSTDKDYNFLSDLYYNEGYAKAKLNKYDDAISAFKQSHYFAKENYQNIWEALEELAFLFKLTENYDESFSYYEKSLKYFKRFKLKQNAFSKSEISTTENRLLNKQNIVAKILNKSKPELNTSEIFRPVESEEFQGSFDTQEKKTKTNIQIEESPNQSKINEKQVIEKENEKEEKDEKLEEEEEENYNQSLVSSTVEKREECVSKAFNLHLGFDNPLNEVLHSVEVIEKTEEKELIVTENKFSDTQLLVMEMEKQLKSTNEDDENEPNQADGTNQILDTNTHPTPRTSISISTPTLTSSSTSTSTLPNDKKGGKNMFTISKRIPKSYSSFNKGTLKNHPEDLRNDQTKNIQQPESSKICTIS